MKLNLPKLSSRRSAEKPAVRRRLSDYQSDAASPPTHSPQSIREDSYAFRRNRTIVGTSSADVNTATTKESTLRSPRAEFHALHRHRRQVSLLLLSVAGAALVLFFVVYQAIATIDISLYGQVGALSKNESTTYQKAIKQYFGVHPLQRFRMSLSKTEFAHYLQTHGHAEVKEVVSVESEGLGSAIMMLRVREPIASWMISGKQYYVDSSGTVFQQNYYNTPAVSIIDKSRVASSEADGVVASSRFLQFIGLASGKLTEYGDTIKNVVIPQNTSREVQFVLATGITIKMTVDRPVGEQCEDAARALVYFKKQNVTPKYIDVRVSREAYYK